MGLSVSAEPFQGVMGNEWIALPVFHGITAADSGWRLMANAAESRGISFGSLHIAVTTQFSLHRRQYSYFRGPPQITLRKGNARSARTPLIRRRNSFGQTIAILVNRIRLESNNHPTSIKMLKSMIKRIKGLEFLISVRYTRTRCRTCRVKCIIITRALIFIFSPSAYYKRTFIVRKTLHYKH